MHIPWWLQHYLFKKKHFQSAVNGKVTIGYSYGQKTLFAGGAPQSGGEHVFLWKKIIANLGADISPHNSLLLGLGGGMILSYIQKTFPDTHSTAIELDPLMIRLAQEEFQLEKSNQVTIICADACTWVQKMKSTYDLIVVDLFIGRENPPCSREKSFLAHLKRIKAPTGVIIYNCAKNPDNISEFEKTHRDFQDLFSEVKDIGGYRYNRVFSLR